MFRIKLLHDPNKKLLLSSKLSFAVSPSDDGSSTSVLFAHLCDPLAFPANSFQLLSSSASFLLPSFFIYELRSLSLSLSLSGRIIATDITRSKRRDRGWWNVIADLAALIEAAVSSFGQISISISIICSTLIRDWKRRGLMEFFFFQVPCQFAQLLVETWIIFQSLESK